MKFTYILFGALVAVSQAVDILHFMMSSTCDGSFAGYTVCPDAVFGSCCATQWGPLNGAWSTRFLGLNHFERHHMVLGFGTVFDDKDGSTGCGSPTTQVGFGAHPCLNLPEGGEIMGALWVGIFCPNPLCGWSGKPGLLDRDALETTPYTRSNKTEGCQKPTQIVFNTGHKFDVGSTTPEIDADLLWDHWKAQTEVKDLPESLRKYEIETEDVEQRFWEMRRQ